MIWTSWQVSDPRTEFPLHVRGSKALFMAVLIPPKPVARLLTLKISKITLLGKKPKSHINKPQKDVSSCRYNFTVKAAFRLKPKDVSIFYTCHKLK